jgi:hypothetical protein
MVARDRCVECLELGRPSVVGRRPRRCNEATAEYSCAATRLLGPRSECSSYRVRAIPCACWRAATRDRALPVGMLLSSWAG